MSFAMWNHWTKQSSCLDPRFKFSQIELYF